MANVMTLELRGGKRTVMVNGSLRGEDVVGHAIIRDDEFGASITTLAWHLNAQGYATTAGKRQGDKRENLHCMVFKHYHGELPEGCYVDHIDRNKLNNNPVNLRAATPSVSSANRGINKNNKCGYRGVVWNQSNTSWRARLMIDRKRIHLGYFKDIIAAAKAVNTAYAVYFPGVIAPNPGII
jgi:HNH endonuclease